MCKSITWIDGTDHTIEPPLFAMFADEHRFAKLLELHSVRLSARLPDGPDGFGERVEEARLLRSGGSASHVEGR